MASLRSVVAETALGYRRRDNHPRQVVIEGTETHDDHGQDDQSDSEDNARYADSPSTRAIAARSPRPVDPRSLRRRYPARISGAIGRIRRDYQQPLRIAELAEQVAMSESAFHRHFKSATALSPLQYQKQLRLLQARQLPTTYGKSVTATALDVGYESPTQFSREYARAFGLPPTQDAARIICSLRTGMAH
jgi:AraC-like DNA-binding protein